MPSFIRPSTSLAGAVVLAAMLSLQQFYSTPAAGGTATPALTQPVSTHVIVPAPARKQSVASGSQAPRPNGTRADRSAASRIPPGRVAESQRGSEPVWIEQVAEVEPVDELSDDEAYAEYLESQAALLSAEDHAAQEAVFELEAAFDRGVMEGGIDEGYTRAWLERLDDTLVGLDGSATWFDVLCVSAICRLSGQTEDAAGEQQLIDDLNWTALDERLAGIRTELMPDGSRLITAYLSRNPDTAQQGGDG